MPHPPAPPSRFARYALAVYVLLIVYASLFPFADWRWQGISPFDFVRAPLPRYITFGDIWLNVAGYLPLGWLLARVLPWQWARLLRWLIAVLLASLLSFSMESTQSLLPMRVASNLDWATNTLGAAIGAAGCVWLLPRLRLAALLRLWRERWFTPRSSYGLLLLALWPLALLWPTPVPLGTGQVLPTLRVPALDSDGWRAFEALLARLGLNPPDFPPPTPLQQTLLTAAMLLAGLLLLAALLRPAAPRLRLALLALLAVVAALTVSSALSFGPAHALAWATPDTVAALLLGAAVATPLLYLPPRWAAALGAAVLAAALVVLNRIGVGPFYIANVEAWGQGMVLRLFGLPQWLSWTWPLAVWVYLLSRLLTRRPV